MKLIFAGTPAFAATALDALVEAGHDIVLVLTQPDRPAGRGLQPQASAVKQRALAQRLPLAQPATLKEAGILQQLRALHADAMIVAAYGLLLPQAVLELPQRGCLNIHASLLPRWRGAAPIQRALLAGDAETGITIMQMDAGLDTGAMVLRESLPIADTDTTQTLHDKLAALGARLIVQALANTYAPVAQDAALATYAAKIRKEEAGIVWTRPAAEISRQIRAFNPAPGATTTWNGVALKLWQAGVVDEHAAATMATPTAAGRIVRADRDGVVVATGAGCVRVTQLQKAGGKKLTAQEFLAGNALKAGMALG